MARWRQRQRRRQQGGGAQQRQHYGHINVRRVVYEERDRDRAHARKRRRVKEQWRGKRERGKAAEQKLARKIKGEQPVSIK